MYITQRENYEAEILKMENNLKNVLPKICDYFGNNEFNSILDELEFFHSHVEEHYNDFENTKTAWLRILSYLKNNEMK